MAVYTPEDYAIVTATVNSTWRFKNRREIQTNLVINNLLDDRGPQDSSIAQTASALRPKGGDYTSPARETVPLTFALKQPISCHFQLTLKMQGGGACPEGAATLRWPQGRGRRLGAGGCRGGCQTRLLLRAGGGCCGCRNRWVRLGSRRR
jgi:hypothetical protein